MSFGERIHNDPTAPGNWRHEDREDTNPDLRLRSSEGYAEAQTPAHVGPYTVEGFDFAERKEQKPSQTVVPQEADADVETSEEPQSPTVPASPQTPRFPLPQNPSVEHAREALLGKPPTTLSDIETENAEMPPASAESAESETQDKPAQYAYREDPSETEKGTPVDPSAREVLIQRTAPNFGGVTQEDLTREALAASYGRDASADVSGNEVEADEHATDDMELETNLKEAGGLRAYAFRSRGFLASWLIAYGDYVRKWDKQIVPPTYQPEDTNLTGLRVMRDSFSYRGNQVWQHGKRGIRTLGSAGILGIGLTASALEDLTVGATQPVDILTAAFAGTLTHGVNEFRSDKERNILPAKPRSNAVAQVLGEGLTAFSGYVSAKDKEVPPMERNEKGKVPVSERMRNLGRIAMNDVRRIGRGLVPASLTVGTVWSTMFENSTVGNVALLDMLMVGGLSYVVTEISKFKPEHVPHQRKEPQEEEMVNATAM